MSIDMGVRYGWNQLLGIGDCSHWEGRFIGNRAYEYTYGIAGNVDYIVMTGVDVDTYFTIQNDWRFVSLLLKQVDTTGADSNAPFSAEFFVRNAKTGQYTGIYNDAGNAMTFAAKHGETWEMSACDCRLRLNATADYDVYPVLTVQYMKPADTFARTSDRRRRG